MARPAAAGSADAAPGTLHEVTFGDSITDGYPSTYNPDSRWPNILADRLLALPARDQLGVLNAGIGGNRILLDGGNGFGPAAISRFQRNLLDQPTVRTVIILEGINDIQQTPHQLDPDAIIAGLQRLIGMAHARGVRVIGATMTPFEGLGHLQRAGGADPRGGQPLDPDQPRLRRGGGLRRGGAGSGRPAPVPAVL